MVAGFLASALVVAGVCADKWSEAEKKIVRLDPRVFSELPDSIVRELKAQGCTIPQTDVYDKPHNVIQGSFAEKNQRDWAVLCSRNGVSAIKVFWGGEAQCKSEISVSEDRQWLQGTGNDTIDYSRLIGPVNRDVILNHHKEYGGPTPPPISHQGIDNYFAGKASVTYYCYEGEWITLTGAD